MHCNHHLVRGFRSVVRLQVQCVVRSHRSTRPAASMQKQKVVVVGAGFAGITAARTLLAEAAVPVDVVIVEASSRVGGRACTKELEGCGKVELGATWFHGIVGNPLYEHAIQFGLAKRHEAEHTKTTWGAMKYVRQNEPGLLGETDAAVITKARDMYGKAVEASLEAASDDQAGVVGDTVREAFAQAMQGMEEASSRSKAVFTEAWAWREQLQRAMDGCHSTDDMSAYSLAQYEEFKGANIPLPSGYQVLAEKLAEGLPIRHGMTVEQIQWGPTGVTLHCQGGEKVEADAAIVTVSLGVLKAQHQHLFQPQLPKETVGAIDRLGFGIVDKLFLDFGAACNPSDDDTQQDFCNYGPAGGSNAEQSKSAQQNHSVDQNSAAGKGQDDGKQALTAKDALSYYLLWNRDPKDFQPRSSVMTPKHDEAKALPAYASRDPLRDINEMSNNVNGMERDYREGGPAAQGAGDKAPETHVVTGPQESEPDAGNSNRVTNAEDSTIKPTSRRQASLPSWAHGAYTVRFAGSEFVQDSSAAAPNAANRCGVVWITGEDAQSMEAESDAELYTHVAAILQEFPALALPGQFKIHRSTWGTDPLFRGSYSYGSAAAVGGECQALAQPLTVQTEPSSVGKIRLLFAGEACHPTYFGCTHGAYLTGQSQARRLLESWNDS